MITHLSFVSIVVGDQDEALDFYTNKLGFEKRGDRNFIDEPTELPFGIQAQFADLDGNVFSLAEPRTRSGG